MSNPTNNLVIVHISERAVYTVMGCQADDKKLQIMAVGEATLPADTFSRGVIIHRERLQNAIKKSIVMADTMGNTRTHSVGLIFSSMSLNSGNIASSVNVDEPVNSVHMAQALTVAKEAFFKGKDYYTSQYFLQMAWADSDVPVKDLIGVDAKKITTSYHLMGLPTSEYNAWCHVLRGVDVDSDFFMCDMVAGATYSLLSQERKAGVLFVDIGKRITKVALYKDDILLFTSCIGFGGDDVTDVIAQTYNMSFAQAQHLKHHETSLDISEKDKQIFVEAPAERSQKSGVINRYRINQTVLMCYNRLFDEIMNRLSEIGLGDVSFFSAGVVVAGGGGQISGFVPYLKKHLKVAVHLSNDSKQGNLNHQISVAGQSLSDNDLAYVRRVIQDKNLQVALGGLLYSFSDDYTETQNRHDPEFSQPTSLYQKMNKMLDKLTGRVKKLA